MSRKNIAIRSMPFLLVLQLSTGASAQTAGLETNPALSPPPSVSMTNAVYKGKAALHLTDLTPDGAATVVPLETGNFQDGTITADIAGQPRERN